MIKRSRTGCITCRRRHIKCDEGRPTCHRCLTANFHCEGYESPRRISNASDRQSSPPQDASAPTMIPSELPWRQANWRQEQLPLYHHYVTSTVVRLFRLDHISFWRDKVGQMSSGIDVVYEALLAVGAAHRGSLLSSSNINEQEAARYKVQGLNAYDRALGLLASHINQNTTANPSTVLVVLLLCTYFECFMENSKGALRHLWAAIQLLRSSEGHLSTIDLANMVPVYEVILRLDFLAQKLVPYAGSSFSSRSDLAFMELPFWTSQSNEYSTTTQSDSILTERHKLMQIICGHESRVVWGGWHSTSERPSRDELLALYNAMMLWKATSPATFKSCPDLEGIYASSIVEFYTFPIPPKPLQFSSSEAAVNLMMFNGCLGDALSLISTTDDDPTAREIEAFNLVYQNLCITAGLIYENHGPAPRDYKPVDTLDLGISIFLFRGARRCFSLDWLQWTMTALRSIGREGLSNAYASANTIEIMGTISPGSLFSESNITLEKSPLGSPLQRLIPLLMPRGDDNQFLAYFLRFGATESESNENIVRIAGRAIWKQNEHGTMQSLEVDTYESTDARAMFLQSGSPDIFSTWRQSVKHGWHGFLS